MGRVEPFEVLTNGLQAIAEEFLHQPIKSMLRCKAVIESKGVSIKY